MSIENNKNYYKNNLENPKGDFGKVTNCLYNFYGLEKLLRKGFMLRNVGKENCQTVSEHIAAVLNLALLINLEYRMEEIDITKVMQMLTIHEYGEIIIGDITPFDGITPEEKHVAEEKAIKYIFKELDSKDYLLGLWNEFEERKTKEAKFAYDMDKLEAALKGRNYLANNKGEKPLEKFYKVTMAQLNFEESKDVLKKAWQNYFLKETLI